MDAELNTIYTFTYILISLLVCLQLRDPKLDEADEQLTAEFGTQVVLPANFLAYFAIYYSVEHVGTVCRDLERNWMEVDAERISHVPCLRS